MPFKLEPDLALGVEIARVIAEQLSTAREMVRSKQTSSAERIHIARTSCKKARAALKLVRAQDKKFYRRENRCLRNAARQLSGLRDADAMLLCVRALLRDHGNASLRRRFEPVRRALLAHRRASLPSKAFVGRCLKVFEGRIRETEGRMAGWVPAGDISKIARDFRRTYRRARAGFFGAEDFKTAEAFHAWRKATKAHAYQWRLLRAAWPATMQERREELRELAARLGEEHDLSVLHRHLRRLRRKRALVIADRDFQAILELIEARRQGVRVQVLPLGARLFAERPRVLAKQLELSWSLAREGTDAVSFPFKDEARLREI